MMNEHEAMALGELVACSDELLGLVRVLQWMRRPNVGARALIHDGATWVAVAGDGAPEDRRIDGAAVTLAELGATLAKLPPWKPPTVASLQKGDVVHGWTVEAVARSSKNPGAVLVTASRTVTVGGTVGSDTARCMAVVQRAATLDELNDWLLRAWSFQRGLR